MTGIYKITSPSNRIYIGQSIDIDKRFYSYSLKHCKFQTKLLHSFNKYNVENHIFEIIEECDESQLNNRERYWQDYYESNTQKGLNCRLTKADDKSGRLSEETKLKMSKDRKGKPSPNKGKKISEEQKAKISETKKRCNPTVVQGVLDTQTGVFYNSIKGASFYYDIKRTTLIAMLKGQNPNKTNLIII